MTDTEGFQPNVAEAVAEAVVEADKSAGVTGVTGDRLRSIIERIERLEEEKKALAEDIKEVFAEAKGDGFKSTLSVTLH